VLRSRAVSTPGFGLLEAARSCYAQGGARAFYRGISMTFFRAAPVAGVTLPAYDTARMLLSSTLKPAACESR